MLIRSWRYVLGILQDWVWVLIHSGATPGVRSSPQNHLYGRSEKHYYTSASYNAKDIDSLRLCRIPAEPATATERSGAGRSGAPRQRPGPRNVLSQAPPLCGPFVALCGPFMFGTGRSKESGPLEMIGTGRSKDRRPFEILERGVPKNGVH